jgi:hypothetical protein
MKLKSTGLGATELTGDLTEMEKAMSGVLMRVKINKPVVWRVRVLIQQKDLRKLIPQLLKPRILWFMVKFFLAKLDELVKSRQKGVFSNLQTNKFNKLQRWKLKILTFYETVKLNFLKKVPKPATAQIKEKNK